LKKLTIDIVGSKGKRGIDEDQGRVLLALLNICQSDHDKKSMNIRAIEAYARGMSATRTGRTLRNQFTTPARRAKSFMSMS